MQTCILTFTYSKRGGIGLQCGHVFLPLHTVIGVGLDLFSPLHTVIGTGLDLFSPLHTVSGVGLEAVASFGQQWYRSLSNPWYPDAVSRQT